MDASLLLLGPEGENNKFDEEEMEVDKERFTSLDGISASSLQKYEVSISKSVVSHRGKRREITSVEELQHSLSKKNSGNEVSS
jgi:hypothetical protein